MNVNYTFAIRMIKGEIGLIGNKFRQHKAHDPDLGGLIPTASNKNKGLVAPDMFSFTRGAVTDANGCSVFGSYKLSPGVLNAPDGIKYGDVLFAVPWDTNTIHQFIYTISGGTYRRVGGKENWSEWVKD